MPGYWRRPIGRMYGYNLDLGETYYNHVMDHVNTSGDRRERGETPGPLSYSERIAASRRYCGTDNVSRDTFTPLTHNVVRGKQLLSTTYLYPYGIFLQPMIPG